MTEVYCFELERCAVHRSGRPGRSEPSWRVFSLEETARRAGCFLRESYPEGFGILPQLPTEAVELSGDVVHGLSQ
jgi:hypothetical protein